MIRHSVLALALVAGASTHAIAWEHILNDYGNGQMLNAAVAYDHTGSATLTFGCVMGSGTFHLQVLTPTPAMPQAMTEMVFEVGGYPLYVPALLGNVEGQLVATASSDGVDTFEIARSVYMSSDPVWVTIEGGTYAFDGGGFSNEAMGAMLDSCAT